MDPVGGQTGSGGSGMVCRLPGDEGREKLASIPGPGGRSGTGYPDDVLFSGFYPSGSGF